MLRKFTRLRRRGRRYARMFGTWRGRWLAVREALLREPREVVVKCAGIRHPVTLRLGTTDVPNSVKVLSGDEYAIELAREPRFIVDAGANVGLAAIYYANKYPGATIVSIEPVASNFALLQRNVAPYPNVLPLLNALWYEPATLEIVDPGWGDDAFRTTNYVAGTVEGNPVQAITVDQIIERYAAKAGVERIDVLKIDIEGAEKELFAAQDGASARRWIDRVDVIAVELHDRFRPGCARAVYNATNGFDYEQRRGYNLFVARSAVLADKGA